MEKYIAYYRVSTTGQGESGLGIAAQEAMVKNFVKCDNCILSAYTEIESGKKDNRPELEKAITHAKSVNGTLVIAKLDRLSRNAAFIFALKDAGVNFVCADMPDANTFTIGIFALLAQQERELISQRTKAALGALKAKGVELGKPSNFSTEGRLKGAMIRKIQAQESVANKQALEWALEYRKQGLTLKQIADKLNNSKYRTSTGKSFAPMSVKRLLDRYDSLLLKSESH
jgi:DNA invertase Pin-like site-specific DNA recombinase